MVLEEENKQQLVNNTTLRKKNTQELKQKILIYVGAFFIALIALKIILIVLF